jgi:hypothetical protein
MTDSQQMYCTLITAFCSHIPRSIFGDVRRLIVLAWAVIGLCFTKTVNFNQWSEVVISKAQYASSSQRRFQRWLYHPRVRPIKFYFPLLRAALSQWTLTETLYLALDTSDLHNGYILIRLSLIYRGRATPVAWRVIRHNSASVSFKQYKVVLKQALLILPKGQRVVLLADRGFVHAELVALARQHHWGYRLRAKSNTSVFIPGCGVTTMAKLCPPKGHAHFYQGVYILGAGIGPVNLALANPDDSDDPWYIISNAPTTVTTLDEYALRFDIEEGFLDDKSGSFQVESSRLDDAHAIARLFLVLAVATLHLTSVGVEVVKRKVRRWVDTHWQRGMSYLKIGLAWVRQQFRRGWPTFPPFGLDPAPDPEPACASRTQAAQPKRKWVVTCFGAP